MRAGPTRAEAPALAVVHAAMLGGIALFAAVAWAIGPFTEVPGAPLLRWAWLAVALASIFGAAVVSQRLPLGADELRVRKTAIAVWALAEGQAMLGLVDYLVTGDRIPAVAGVLLFVYLLGRHRPSTFRRPGSGR